MGTDSTVVTNEQSIGQAVVVYITRSNASEREFIQQFTTVATNANLSARLVALDTRPSGSVDDTASFFLSVSTLPWVVCRDVWFSIANFPYSPGSVVLLNESSAVVWHPTGYGDPSWQTALKNL